MKQIETKNESFQKYVYYKNPLKSFDFRHNFFYHSDDLVTKRVYSKPRELCLKINGEFTHFLNTRKRKKEGAVGFGVSSYGAYPVKINVYWLEISEP